MSAASIPFDGGPITIAGVDTAYEPISLRRGVLEPNVQVFQTQAPIARPSRPQVVHLTESVGRHLHPGSTLLNRRRGVHCRTSDQRCRTTREPLPSHGSLRRCGTQSVIAWPDIASTTGVPPRSASMRVRCQTSVQAVRPTLNVGRGSFREACPTRGWNHAPGSQNTIRSASRILARGFIRGGADTSGFRLMF